MAKVNTIANNGLTIVENYNKLLEQFRKTKTIDDVRILVASVRDFISVYKRVDKNMVNEIYEKLQGKLQDMVAENAFVYDRMNNRVEEIRNRGYDYANEQDDTQAVQSKALQLMSQMPKVMNSNHANRITKVLTDSINSVLSVARLFWNCLNILLMLIWYLQRLGSVLLRVANLLLNRLLTD